MTSARPRRAATSLTPPLHDLHDGPRNRPASTPHGVATAHFGELRAPLLAFVAGSEVLVGCVAWVTDKQILDALAHRQVALVVQKESWWKKTDARGVALAARYAALRGGLDASAFPAPLATKTFRNKPVPNDAVLAPIACAGHNAPGGFAPLMHHKFVVRCHLVDGVLVPTAVWTGSFNFSGNADKSFENAVEIHDATIAAAYLAEFALVASLSESLNWRSRVAKPAGVGKVFAAPPTKTTTRVVKKGTSTRRRTASKKTGVSTRPATKKTAPARQATVTALRPAKKVTAPRPRKKAS